MKTKHKYIPPAIIKIVLDNEISLALESEPIDPPFGPGELGNSIPPDFNNEPFKSNLG